MKLWQVAIALVLILIVVGMWAASGYNSVIGLDESANKAWAEVDNQLKRRADLIPELINTVKGAGIQEQTVFLGIANARKAYFEAQNIPQKQAAGQQMDSALSRLLLLQEQYPELKSNEAFLNLQTSLEGTENRLSVARQRYNEAVQILNTYVKQLPGRFYAMLAGVDKRTYYEIKVGDRETPSVDFSDLRGEATGSKKPAEAKPTDDKPEREPAAEPAAK
jgi:LemA protein